MVTTARNLEVATVLAHPDLTIPQGTTIPCAFDTAKESSAPGLVRCTVTDDVHSTIGTVILLERGTRITPNDLGRLWPLMNLFFQSCVDANMQEPPEQKRSPVLHRIAEEGLGHRVALLRAENAQLRADLFEVKSQVGHLTAQSPAG